MAQELAISKLGLGTNQFGSKVDLYGVERILATALDHGVSLIDTAELYSNGESERLIGEALSRLKRRHEAVIATKFNRDSDPLDAVEASLERLKTDYIDLYQIHYPNPDVPIEETLGKLNTLVVQGKVRAIGNSNFAGWQIADAEWIARSRELARFQTAQNRYNLLELEAETEVIPACLRFGLGLITWFPLAAGMLTGKYRRGQPAPANARLRSGATAAHFLADPMFDKVEALEAYAAENGVSLLDVAIGGLAAVPPVASVIAGATAPEQVIANAKAAEWRPSSEQLERLRKTLEAA